MSDPSVQNEQDEVPSVAGIPWQIIYTAFMGLAICALGIFCGLALMNAPGDWKVTLAGVAVIVLALVMGISSGAMLAGASWGLWPFRILVALGLVGLAFRLAQAIDVLNTTSNELEYTQELGMAIGMSFGILMCILTFYFLFSGAVRRHLSK
jgi:hypothetical protein